MTGQGTTRNQLNGWRGWLEQSSPGHQEVLVPSHMPESHLHRVGLKAHVAWPTGSDHIKAGGWWAV